MVSNLIEPNVLRQDVITKNQEHIVHSTKVPPSIKRVSISRIESDGFSLTINRKVCLIIDKGCLCAILVRPDNSNFKLIDSHLNTNFQ